jgi:hypothetical protein
MLYIFVQKKNYLFVSEQRGSTRHLRLFAAHPVALLNRQQPAAPAAAFGHSAMDFQPPGCIERKERCGPPGARDAFRTREE